jgi:hypothetical protein
MINLTGSRKPQGRMDDRDLRRRDVRAGATALGTIEVRFEIAMGANKGSSFVIVIDQGQFDGLAKEMMKANREAATSAFLAVLQGG